MFVSPISILLVVSASIKAPQCGFFCQSSHFQV
jgi:hypothetical protein